MQEMQIRSLGWEDSLEEEMGTLLQYSCLGNLMDRGAWGATVHCVAELDMTKCGFSVKSSGAGAQGLMDRGRCGTEMQPGD